MDAGSTRYPCGCNIVQVILVRMIVELVSALFRDWTPRSEILSILDQNELLIPG